MSGRSDFDARIRGSLAVIGGLLEQLDVVEHLAGRVVETLERGGTIYTVGNGGSAAEALHFAEELIGRYRDDRPAQRAVCLNSDPTALTCIANDYGYEHVFSRQCEALLTQRDLLVVFSTSGRSANLKRAMQCARNVGCPVIALLGRGGGDCRNLCEEALVVASNDSAHIQEAHQVVMHLLCEAVEASAAAREAP